MSIEVVTRSKPWVCGHSIAGIAGSNPAEGMDVRLFCLLCVVRRVGGGFCDGLITRPGDFYRVCMSNCLVQKPKTLRGLVPSREVA
jgi:hypothetical protein